MTSDRSTGSSTDAGPYVISFAESFERMPLAVPFLHELDHFSAFRSHTIERGRAVFRLHVGYFETQDAARAGLQVVRRHYTDAYISSAPRRGLGSLDDTGITEFSMSRQAGALASPAGEAARAAVRAEAAPATGAALCETALQRYAVQLDALAGADSRASTPELGELRGFLLYRVHVLLDGRVHQAARLGFFPSSDAAQRALNRLRDRFPRANLVPVSDREYARVRDLVTRGADSPVRARGAIAALMPGPTARTTATVPGAGDADFGSDVSCEFGANELPTSGSGHRSQPHR